LSAAVRTLESLPDSPLGGLASEGKHPRSFQIIPRDPQSQVAVFLRQSVLFQRNDPKSDRNTLRIISETGHGVKTNICPCATVTRGTAMSEMSFLIAVFAVIEHLNKSELTTTSKKLIIAYVNEATGASLVEKARAAVFRYTQTVLPGLEAIRKKSQTVKLDKLDHLVLKLEFEASRLPA
jgi:hypothetical protein